MLKAGLYASMFLSDINSPGAQKNWKRLSTRYLLDPPDQAHLCRLPHLGLHRLHLEKWLESNIPH
jgi:hypothetical protein